MKYPICKKCNHPVKVSEEEYNTFEQMHWICFHFTFEHFTDPDEPCEDHSCPWNRISDGHLEGYKTMILFLKKYQARAKSDDIDRLLNELRLLENGTSANPTALSDWEECMDDILVAKFLNEKPF